MVIGKTLSALLFGLLNIKIKPSTHYPLHLKLCTSLLIVPDTKNSDCVYSINHFIFIIQLE